MKKLSESNEIPGLPQPWLLVAQLLVMTALGVSFFLLWGSLTRENLPGCGLESGCNAVMHSRWAFFLGLPVSLPAACLYVFILIALSMQKRAISPILRRRLWYFLCFAIAAVSGAALWFIGLQLFLIRAICPFCMVAHVCGLVFSLVLIARFPAAAFKTSTGKPLSRSVPLLSKAAVRKFALAGLASVVLLVIGQAAHRPKSFAEQTMTERGRIVTNLTVAGQTPASAQAPLAEIHPTISSVKASDPGPQPASPHRLMMLHGDAFALDLNELPLLGSPDAPHVIVQLFDYSCHYCRQLHSTIANACRKRSNDLAVISIPMPMDCKCNPVIRRQLPDHTNACEYARIGLAVWRAQREKLAEFDDWIFAPERPLSPSAVQAEAMRLVGSNAFLSALNDPRIQQQLDLGIRLYSTNRARYKKSNLPQLMIGTNLISGVITSNDFDRLFARQFDPDPPVSPQAK